MGTPSKMLNLDVKFFYKIGGNYMGPDTRTRIKQFGILTLNVAKGQGHWQNFLLLIICILI